MVDNCQIIKALTWKERGGASMGNTVRLKDKNREEEVTLEIIYDFQDR